MTENEKQYRLQYRLKTKAYFAKRLKELLEKNNKQQIELAKAIGVSRSVVSQWCSPNNPKVPALNKLWDISNYFGVLPSYFDYESDERVGLEQEFLALFNSLTPEQQERAIKILKATFFE